jgi:hypothetical protein
MFLPDQNYSTDTLYNQLLESPVSKGAIAFFSEVYKVAKSFVAPSIFASLRPRVEETAGMSLNLRSKVDKARFGRILTISELTYRGHSLEGFTPVKLLGETQQQQEIDFPEPPSGDDLPDRETENEDDLSHQLKRVTQERDRAQEKANHYHKQLEEFEAFTQILLLGRIFPEPITTNGLEDAPLLQVFGGARSLSEVHQAYKTLRKAWHPDISPYSESETNARFDWLKKAYTTLVTNWSRFDPQNKDIPQERIEKLKAQKLRWSPESFWYW